MPNKYQRFTNRTRRVMSLAGTDAETLNYAYIGTEHLLIALMREAGGIASRALATLGINDESVVRASINKFVRTPPAKRDGQLDLNDECKDVLYLAVECAREMNDHFIGTEHLLLGLVRQEKCIGCRALYDLGTTPDQVRKVVEDIVRNNPRTPENISPIDVKPEIEPYLPTEVRRILDIARQYAEQQRSKELEPEHLLLGLLDIQDSRTFTLFSEIGIEHPMDTVRSAAMSIAKRKDAVIAIPLPYSNATQTALTYTYRLATGLGTVTAKDLLIGLTSEDWLLVRLWSTYNIDAYTLQSALARTGLGSPPRPRYSFKETLTTLLARIKQLFPAR